MIPALERATALRAAAPFAPLDADDLIAFAALADETEVATGERVFAEGDPGDAVFVVVRGRVRVERGGRALAVLGVGDCFGEIAVLDEGPRSAGVVADVPTLLLRIERDDFLDLLTLYPAVARALLEMLARRLRASQGVAG